MLNLYTAKNHGTEADPLAAKNSPKGSQKKVSFESYVDPTGEFPSNELKMSMWFVRNKMLLYKVFIGSLVGVIILLYGYSLWKWGSYLIFGITQDKAMEKAVTRTVNYSALNKNFTAAPIEIAGTTVLSSDQSKFDLIAEVSNPNERFQANFDYYFELSDGTKTVVQKGFLLPGENKPLVYLGYDNLPSNNAEVVIENLQWSRIDPHQILDVKAWQEERLDFSVKDFNFTNYRDPEGANAHIIKFNLTNNTIYGYVEPNFYVELYQNQSLVGILPLHLDRLRAGETVNVDLRSFAPDLDVSEVKIFPLLNLYDSAVYLPLELN